MKEIHSFAPSFNLRRATWDALIKDARLETPKSCICSRINDTPIGCVCAYILPFPRQARFEYRGGIFKLLSSLTDALVNLVPKLYIPSAINIWKKLLSRAIWADKNGQVSGRIACMFRKTWDLKQCSNLVLFILNLFNLKCIFIQKTWKVKETTHDLYHDLTFYCTHN